MNKYFNIIPAIILLGVIITSCNKTDNRSGDKVEIYLLDSFDTLEIAVGYQIKLESVVLKSAPLITYDEILSYDPETYIFKLSPEATDRIKNQQQDLHKVAFGIKANDELIYTAYFWALYSSTLCDWMTADPLFTLDDGLKIKLGYPSQIDGIHIPDDRNDQKILDIFEKDGKLK